MKKDSKEYIETVHCLEEIIKVATRLKNIVTIGTKKNIHVDLKVSSDDIKDHSDRLACTALSVYTKKSVKP
jgi:hypothetical protein